MSYFIRTTTRGGRLQKNDSTRRCRNPALASEPQSDDGAFDSRFVGRKTKKPCNSLILQGFFVISGGERGIRTPEDRLKIKGSRAVQS